MAIREIINIDETKCNGCGLCIPGCPEGALQVIDGKLRLVSELLCDGLGACLKECPQDAISITKREAEAYDEEKVIANLLKQGEAVVQAHLAHLQDHGQTEYLKTALDYLKRNGKEVPEMGETNTMHHHHGGGCPGSRMVDFAETESGDKPETGNRVSQLRQWPVQLHLVSPLAPYFQAKDVVLAADCVAYALADFHKDYLAGKSLAIACPKLDAEQEAYEEKITTLVDEAKINTLTVMTMEVPCCGGLLALAQAGVNAAARKNPIKSIVVGLRGDILREDWV